MRLEEYPDREMLAMGLANRLAGEINGTLLRRDRASFAVPGGTTPGPVFDSLSGADLPWDRVDVVLTDERLVPATSERSNERLLRERLLVGPAAAAPFLRLVPEAGGPDVAALGEALRPHLPLSVALLGMGEDLHTASLFPGAPQLGAALAGDAPPLMVIEPPGAPEPRVSLTAPVLRAALSVHLLITGPEKRAALERARRSRDPAEAPVAAILAEATVHWAE